MRWLAGAGSTLWQPIDSGAGVIGNRWTILPMEGWDGEADGTPTDLTRRRWRNFGLSGAGLIWGGEAVAVRHDGRANPNQLMLNDVTAASIESLREELVGEFLRYRDGAPVAVLDLHDPQVGVAGDRPGAAWYDRGTARVLFDFTVVDGRVAGIVFRADPDVLADVVRRDGGTRRG